MKKFWKKTTAVMLCCVFIAGIFACVPPVKAQAEGEWPSGPSVESPSAIVMEVNTRTVLYEKDADTKRYPASTTKVLTALLALENSSLDEIVTFSKDAVYKNEGNTSHIARDVGEQMTMEQCLYAIMLESANECAYAVAEHVGGGDYQAFIRMMNERAEELGCTNTNFTNSNGLPDEKHVTTCRDLALISCEAIKNPTFRKIIGTTRYTIPPTNKHKSATPLNNHHQMRSVYKTAKYLYDYCIGGKTGYTDAASNTLVTYAEKDGLTLVCVVMKSSGNHYPDTRKLFDYCFDKFQMVNVSQNEDRFGNDEPQEESLFAQGEDFVELDPGAQIVLPKTADFADTTVEPGEEEPSGDVLGTLVYSYGGKQVGTANVVVKGVKAEPAEFGKITSGTSGKKNTGAVSREKLTDEEIEKEAAHERNLHRIVILIIIAGAAVVALLIVRFLYNNIHRIWRRRAARDRRYKRIRNNRKWNKRGGRWS